MLLEAGADVNKKTPDNGMTALWCAADFGRVAMVEALLEAGANPNLVKEIPAGNSCLHVACQNGHDEVALALLRGGARINHMNKPPPPRDNHHCSAPPYAVSMTRQNTGTCAMLAHFGAQVLIISSFECQKIL